jgi:hypothetical protein
MLQLSTLRRACVAVALSAATFGVAASALADPAAPLDPGVYRGAFDAPAAIAVRAHLWTCFASNNAGGYGTGWSTNKQAAEHSVVQYFRGRTRRANVPCMMKWCR